jgi:hypothetical protein
MAHKLRKSDYINALVKSESKMTPAKKKSFWASVRAMAYNNVAKKLYHMPYKSLSKEGRLTVRQFAVKN